MSFSRENIGRAITCLQAAREASVHGDVALALDNISDAESYIESARGHLKLDKADQRRKGPKP